MLLGVMAAVSSSQAGTGDWEIPADSILALTMTTAVEGNRR